MGVKVTVDKTDDVMRAVKVLTKRQVLIGIPETGADRKVEDDDKTPITNAAIGYISEFGSPINNIPARPSLVPGIESIKDQAIARLKRAGQAALDGDIKPIDKELTAIGVIGQAAVQQKITDGPFEPLAPRTIVDRARKGFAGIKPLLRSGQFRQAITFGLRDKGK